MTDAPPGLFDDLLDPIPGATPAGVSLRWGPVHAEIEEARRADDDLPRGVWVRDMKRADDGRVIALCRAALRERSKDLQCACWLVEAAARAHGPAAAAQGLAFLAALNARWWEGLHPAHDGDPDSPRLAPLAWLDGALAMALATWPVAVADTDDGTAALGWSDYAAAMQREAAGRGSKPSRAAREWLTVARFDEIADETDAAALRATLAGAEAVPPAAAALTQTLAGLLGDADAAPGFGRARSAARDLAALIAPILARRPAPPPPLPTPMSEPFAAEIARMSDALGPPPPQPPALTGAPADRDAAYAALAEIAAYLRRIEPHSLTPYLVERAVRWGAMTAPEVMADLSRNGRDPDMLKWLLES